MKSQNLLLVSFLIFILFLAALAESIAQPSLNFRTINVQWPTVTLFTEVKCDSVLQTNLLKNNFQLCENGVDIQDFTVISADTIHPCCMSVALVFDRSGSMGWGTPSGIEGAKQGGKAFVDMMDGVCDEASIISFNHLVTIDVIMTTNKVNLLHSIDTLRAIGGDGVWDAVDVGVQELISRGKQTCKAIIFLTDGLFQSSYLSEDIFALSLMNKIKIFMIGLGTGINDADLTRVASETGGKYYKVRKPDDLIEVYKEIYRTIRNGFYQSEITYDTKCQDGSRRNVNLTVQNLSSCSGTDTKTKSYKTPRDTSTFQPIAVSLTPTLANQNSFVEMPVRLQTAINDLFQPATFRIMFDTTCLQFANCYLDNTLLDGAGVNVTSIPEGVEVKTLQSKMINGSGVIAKLVFRTLARGDSSYRQCPVVLSDWKFQAGCFKVFNTSCEIVLDVQSMESEPNTFVLSQNYPNPFSSTTTIRFDLTPTLSYEERVTEGRVRSSLIVYDVLGRKVAILVDGEMEAGEHSILFDAKKFNLRSGIYVYELRSGVNAIRRRMLVTR